MPGRSADHAFVIAQELVALLRVVRCRVVRRVVIIVGPVRELLDIEPVRRSPRIGLLGQHLVAAERRVRRLGRRPDIVVEHAVTIALVRRVAAGFDDADVLALLHQAVRREGSGHAGATMITSKCSVVGLSDIWCLPFRPHASNGFAAVAQYPGPPPCWGIAGGWARRSGHSNDWRY